jgi:hypothetical protein
MVDKSLGLSIGYDAQVFMSPFCNAERSDVFWESDCGIYGVTNGSTPRDVWRLLSLNPLLYHLDYAITRLILYLYVECGRTESPSGMSILQSIFLSSLGITLNQAAILEPLSGHSHSTNSLHFLDLHYRRGFFSIRMII